MDTIIQKYAEHPAIYHGIVTAKYGNCFIFCFRINGKNMKWECHYDYWILIQDV